MERTANYKFLELCDEIDYWKERALEAEKNAEHWQSEYRKHLNESLLSTQKDVANILSFALCISDDKDGNLVILKEDRQKLSDNFK